MLYNFVCYWVSASWVLNADAVLLSVCVAVLCGACLALSIITLLVYSKCEDTYIMCLFVHPIVHYMVLLYTMKVLSKIDHE